jgi:hypothetical protein
VDFPSVAAAAAALLYERVRLRQKRLRAAQDLIGRAQQSSSAQWRLLHRLKQVVIDFERRSHKKDDPSVRLPCHGNRWML